MSTEGIIELARGGDTGAFAQIVRQYQSLVSGVLYSATGDFHKSEDFTQETFLIAWQKLGELRDPNHLAAWLCTIARNLVHRSHRKATLETVSLSEDTGGLATSGLASAAHAPDAELLRREQSEFVWSAIGEIDEKYRETLVLYYRSGQSVREIASATASTEEAVRQRLVRARKSLKVKLEEMVGNILTDTIPGEAFTMTVMTALGAAMLTTATAQAAVAATTGTTVATGAATTGGKTLGMATIWSVIGPAAYAGWFIALWFAMFWAAVRNAPTLRARRFRVYSIFWNLQYFNVLIVITTPCGLALAWILVSCGLTPYSGFLLSFSVTFLFMFSVMHPHQSAFSRKMQGIIKNDIGVSSAYVESYSYPQIERRFFLSLITNLLLAITWIAFVAFAAIADGEYADPVFLVFLFGGIAAVAVIVAVYYPLGRYFLEICRTKQSFLAAPPLVDNPVEVALMRVSKHPASVDHPKKAGGMFGVILLAWSGLAAMGIWYFAQFSWDKHPIPLGICVALCIAITSMPTVLKKKVEKPKNMTLLNVLSLFCVVPLVFVLEYIEFGRIFNFVEFWSKPSFHAPYYWVHVVNSSVTIISVLFILSGLRHWWKAKRAEGDTMITDEELLLQEAIARFDPVTMTEDEPEVATQPFPRRWLWIIGLYTAAVVVMGCLGVLLR
ncbi:MAG: sigma-70 family RNA polymerase sigma factor [Planctomycetaceae bacterium]|nr:sigma-70 family RNA polymerase sigma factor [Planctomycetaceae bacterium]